jgi:hypothetical protein
VIVDSSYDPSHGKTPEQMLEWHVFMLFLARKCGWHPLGASRHVEWVLQRPFITVEEWLGDEGIKFRQQWRMPESPQSTKEAWLVFLEKNRGRTQDDVVAELIRLEQEAETAITPSAKRGRRKTRTASRHRP